MKTCFPPIIDKNARVLIMGSFPGAESLRKQEYYAYKQNQFWKIMGDIFHENINGMNYDEKKACLLRNRVALWDAIHVCEREGSLDSNIRNEDMNDFSKLKMLAPNLGIVCFNGQKAGKYSSFFHDYKTVVLPSTSPAHTIPYVKKLAEWNSAISDYILA